MVLNDLGKGSWPSVCYYNFPFGIFVDPTTNVIQENVRGQRQVWI